MLSPIRKRLTYANVVATLALVFAMSGGAYAASKFLITSTKQIKPSVLASLKGKSGAAGAAGAQGPAGPGGAQGPAGAAGKEGAPGKEGPQGKEGVAGKNGTNGKEGSPWTDGGTLPHEATETGAWALAPQPPGESPLPLFAYVSISFNVPLSAPLGEGHTVFVNSGEVGTGGCAGGTAETPTAEAGYLCVYYGQVTGIAPYQIHNPARAEEKDGAGTAGALLLLGPLEHGEGAAGTWAVTAP